MKLPFSKKKEKYDPKIMLEILINSDVVEAFINDDPEKQKERINNFIDNFVEYGGYDAYVKARESAAKKNIAERKRHGKEQKRKRHEENRQ